MNISLRQQSPKIDEDANEDDLAYKSSCSELQKEYEEV